MKRTKLQQNEIDVIQSNNGLRLYLNSLEAGHAATPRSSLYNIPGKTVIWSPDRILNEWLHELDLLRTSSSFYEQEVFQFDLKQLEKWGPQGGVSPIAELLDDIVLPSFKHYARPRAFSSRAWQEAKKYATRRLIKLGAVNLRPASYKSVVDDMRVRDTLESNSGWPLFTRRNNPEVIAQSIEAAENGEWIDYPAIALFRNYNNKTRLVWMFPMSTNLVEGSFFQPLQSVLMREFPQQGLSGFFAPWKGFEEVRKRVSDSYAVGDFLSASDFSKTDEHFQLWSSLEVFDVLQWCFQEEYRSALKQSITWMHSIPLVVGPTTKITGYHGVSSGSNWTNFIETIFDLIFAVYVSIREMKYNRSVQGLYAIGDDMTWVAQSYDPEFAARLEDYGDSVGQVIKAEKTTNDRAKVKSLQRLFQDGYFQQDSQISLRAVYPTVRALKSLVYPERMHKKNLWSKDMAAVRAFMILENCIDHPLFYQFCEFVAKGDPHLREFAKRYPSSIDRAARQAKLVPGLNPTYNQERRDSKLSEFASIKYLASEDARE